MGARAIPLRKIACVTEQEAIYVESVLKGAITEAQRRLGKESGTLLEIENDGTFRVLVSRERIETHKAAARDKKESRGSSDAQDQQDRNSRADRWVADVLRLIGETVCKLSPGRHVVSELDPGTRQHLDGRLDDLVDGAQGLKTMLGG